MSHPAPSDGPDLPSVRSYLEKFRAPKPTASATTKGKPARRLRPADQEKYRSACEDIWRSWVVRIALPLCGLFLVCAVLCVVLRRSIVPWPTGSHALIELTLMVFPGAYMVAAAHNVFLAAVAVSFAVAASDRGHMEIPGNPLAPTTLVCRRTARFAHGPCLCLLGSTTMSLWLRAIEWAVPASLVEGAAFMFFLEAAARLWIPLYRRFLVIEIDSLHDGLLNRVTCGHGRAWRFGTIVIPHDHLIDVTSHAGWLEACVGLRSLTFTYITSSGAIAVTTLRALGSPNLVAQIEHLLKGSFLSARGTAAIKAGTSLQPTVVVK